jgi:hypothetical protein
LSIAENKEVSSHCLFCFLPQKAQKTIAKNPQVSKIFADDFQ